ncbi:hypothetical protein KUL152_00310 [Tenacibaculum sp. KUL152]|nr:hypothetical protein KUL152_00310 [Tenacibaculum sp. KUL152]
MFKKGLIMFLVRLIYASTVGESFKPSDIESILRSARKNNRQHGITGMLCFNSRYFLQCLEGSRSAVNDCFSLIQTDTRHKSLMLLSYGEISQRTFSSWEMAYVSEQAMTKRSVLQFSTKDAFDPYSMLGDSALSLLADFKPLAE